MKCFTNEELYFLWLSGFFLGMGLTSCIRAIYRCWRHAVEQEVARRARDKRDLEWEEGKCR